MLTVKTKVKYSSIAGLGLFADQKIKKGAVIWQFQKGFDVIFTEKQIKKLPVVANEFILNFIYLNEKEGGYILCMDNARYTNHSYIPNTMAKGKKTLAARDIEAGEEITENYYTFDDLALSKLDNK